MSGIEIAGLVLGAFPLAVKALKAYREGFQLLRKWYKFRTQYESFLRSLQVEKLQFDMVVQKLLQDIVHEDELFWAMVDHPTHRKWGEQDLWDKIDVKLGGKGSLFRDIMQNMLGTLQSILKLLKCENNDTAWLYSSNVNWKKQFHRIRISLSEQQDREIMQLRQYNQELQILLGYGDEMRSLKKHRDDATGFEAMEKFRKVSWRVADALLHHFRDVPHQACSGHRAILSLECGGVETHLYMVLQMDAHCGSVIQPVQQIVKVSLCEKNVDDCATPQTRQTTLPHRPPAIQPGRKSRRVQFAPSSTTSRSLPRAPTPPMTLVPLSRGHQLCLQLADAQAEQVWSLSDESDEFDTEIRVENIQRHPYMHQLCRHPITTLETLLQAHRSQTLGRESRYRMASGIASALLLISRSPWLTGPPAKSDFIFASAAQGVQSVHPCILKHFQNAPPASTMRMSDEETRDLLYRTGIIIIELIFNTPLEAADKRRQFCDRTSGQPNDLTDFCTAQALADELFVVCGEEIQRAVRRCLSFKNISVPPNLADRSFREEIYQSIIRPLKTYAEAWPVDDA